MVSQDQKDEEHSVGGGWHLEEVDRDQLLQGLWRKVIQVWEARLRVGRYLRMVESET
jgi:hypothetical protein